MLFFPTQGISARRLPPRAVEGVLDLRDWDFSSQGSISLEGEWEFYWGQLLSDADFLNPELEKSLEYIRVPGYWNQEENGSFQRHGCATYRLVVLLPPFGRELLLGFHSGDFYTAYQVFLGDLPPFGKGIVSRYEKTASASVLPSVRAFAYQEEELVILIQVANFSHRNGGVFQSPTLGNPLDIHGHTLRKRVAEALTLGILLSMLVYHLVCLNYRREDKTYRSFSLLCFAFFVRIGLTGQRQFLLLLGEDLPYGFIQFLEYSSVFLITSAIVQHFHYLLGERFPIQLRRFVNYLAGFAAVFSLLTPSSITSYIIPPFQLVVFGATVAIGVLCTVLAIKRVPYAALSAISLLIGAMTLVNDILHQRMLIYTGYYTPYGFIGIILAQIIILASKYAESAIDSEEMLVASNKFVPNDFLKRLGRTSLRQLRLGDQVHTEMTMLFIDIRSFCTLAEKMSPEEIFAYVNSYLSRVGPIIRLHQGFIDKYLGDGILALFDQADDAVLAARAINQEMLGFNLYRKHLGEAPVCLGMGLHSGATILGIVGENERLDSTVISDAVNIAARLQELTKTYACVAIISDTTFCQLSPTLKEDLPYLDRVCLRGRNEPVCIYQLIK